jgi:WD40-like Beta Propeller Repeat
MHKAFLLLLTLLIVSGCASSAGSTPTPGQPTRSVSLSTPVPTLAVTALPSPTAGVTIGPPAPTIVPTITPSPSGILPAPLYVLDYGQIARIERDGKSRNLVTSEKVDIQGVEPIATFAVSRAGNIAYVVGDLKADRLVWTEPRGENKRTLYEAEGHELSNLVWSKDGQQIYLRVLNNRQPPDKPSGIYRIASAGGPLELLRADDPVDNVAHPSPTINGYRPFAFSPDGSRLLVEIYSIYYDGCSLGIIPAAGGDIVRLNIPLNTKTFCGEAAWSPDGTAVYFLAGPDSGPTIWRGDASSGATTAMAAADVLSRAPVALSDGSLRFFLLRRDPPGSGPVTFVLSSLITPQTAPVALGAPLSDRLGQVLWSPDGTGAVISVVPTNKPMDLRWMPADGEPLSLPNSSQGINGMAWGSGL